MERTPEENRRESNIARGIAPFGFSESPISSLSEGDNITFIYDAERSGFNKKNRNYPLYDLNPNIVLIKALRSRKSGKIIIYGLNVNYLDSKLERGRLILYSRTQAGINQRLFEKAIHCYSLSRVKSKIFKSNKTVSDLSLMRSAADWVRANKI